MCAKIIHMSKYMRKHIKKVLLTGATGLIGKYAIEPLLDAGFEVFAVSSTPHEKQGGLNWVSANLLDSEDIKKLFEKVKPEYLLHFAWDTTPGSYLESDLNFDWVKASIEMLEQFNLYGGKRAVFAGTCFEYEFEDKPLNEVTSKINPISTYAKCKNQLRELASDYCDSKGISFGWGRIFYVFGEGENENRLVPKVINTLREDKEMSFSTGDLVKDYMFAGDIAEAFVKFLDSKVLGCINICTGMPVTIKEIVITIAKKLNKEHLVTFVDDKVSNQPKIIIGDNTRLANEVGFTPKYSLESALNILIKGSN